MIVGYLEILAMRDRTGENAEIIDHMREAAAELGARVDEVVAADAATRST